MINLQVVGQLVAITFILLMGPGIFILLKSKKAEFL